MTTLVWFRQDLRLTDNPALSAALREGGPIVPVYLYAPEEEGPWRPGEASRWWLHHSLERLSADLTAYGSRLVVRRCDFAAAELAALAAECGATRVVWDRRYEPDIIARDQGVKAHLRAVGIAVESFNGALLHEPWTISSQSGGPFQVFTPFWRRCLSLEDPQEPLPAPTALPAVTRWPKSRPLAELGLLPHIDWASGLRAHWTPGSAGAQAQLTHFLEKGFDDYSSRRDQPAVPGTSRLSPHLHFGEISPREVWHSARGYAAARGDTLAWRDSKFLTEVGWREFAHHLLYHFPRTPQEPLRANFARFPWQADAAAWRRWKRGTTGFPIVDAGLRELWQTGWMHNRVRMIAASFLIKDLLIPWTDGARWFWDTLVDADLASNTLGWQWVAGCGADAAPFFRIFNPTLQGRKFDPDGHYVRRWIPELAALPNDWIHEPAKAPGHILAAAGVTLGQHYPQPVVDHDAARRSALSALATISGSSPAR